MKELFQEKIGLGIVVALMVAYSVYFSALSIQRHDTFRTNASDLGQMDQALWNTLHGHFLEDTRDNGDQTARQAPRLTDHVEPIFLVVSLVYLVYDGVEAILVLQSIAIALGALPVYWIAKRRLKRDWAAIGFAAMYLLFPALQAANLAEFHADTLAPVLLLFAFNYAQERAWARFALFAFLAMTVKEEIPLLVMMMSIWVAVQATGDKLPMGRWLSIARSKLKVYVVPAVIAVVALAWFLTALFVIVPRFSPAGRSVYVGRYTCATQALKDPVSAIPQLVGCVLVPDKIEYVVGLLAAAGLIALLDPIALLIGSPVLVMNLLSSYPAQYSGTYHYSAPVAPYFVLAAIGGAAWLSGWLARRLALKHALALVVAPAFAVALGYQAMAGYTPVGGEYFWPSVTPHQQLFDRFAKEIPPDVPVATTASLFPHLSHRRFLYRFPTIQDAEYILLDVSQANTKNPIDFRLNYLEALKQGFGIRDAVDGYILLQRGAAQKELPDGFYNFLRACHCIQPQQPVTVDFDNKIRFLGYDVRQDDWQRVYLRTYWTRLPGFDNQNYALFPFFVDDNGERRADAVIPDLLVHFWYPTSRWQGDEVIVADTTPIDLGPGAKIGVDVFFGATWENAEWRLAPQTDAPVAADGSWVSIGELVRDGKTYRVVR